MPVPVLVVSRTRTVAVETMLMLLVTVTTAGPCGGQLRISGHASPDLECAKLRFSEANSLAPSSTLHSHDPDRLPRRRAETFTATRDKKKNILARANMVIILCNSMNKSTLIQIVSRLGILIERELDLFIFAEINLCGYSHSPL